MWKDFFQFAREDLWECKIAVLIYLVSFVGGVISLSFLARYLFRAH